jgi:hypothetical protein
MTPINITNLWSYYELKVALLLGLEMMVVAVLQLQHIFRMLPLRQMKMMVLFFPGCQTTGLKNITNFLIML